MFSGCFTLDSAWVSLSFLLVTAVAIHRHPSLITLRSASNDPSGGRRPAQIPQLDTTQASKESHNSIHNPDPLVSWRGDTLHHTPPHSACVPLRIPARSTPMFLLQMLKTWSVTRLRASFYPTLTLSVLVCVVVI